MHTKQSVDLIYTITSNLKLYGMSSKNVQQNVMTYVVLVHREYDVL
jgi:hypothetical protein